MLRCWSLVFPITLRVRYFAISVSAKTASSLTDYQLPITNYRLPITDYQPTRQYKYLSEHDITKFQCRLSTFPNRTAMSPCNKKN
ncbi:hypothetical protein [Fischerella thermalis]|uniref:hypothetical protein n=1 Tax=Fischerella thermalis TaxID=372787 RepID=UPI00307E4B41